MKKGCFCVLAILSFLMISPIVSAQDEEPEFEQDPCIQEIPKKLERQFEKARDLQREGKKAEAIAEFNVILEEKDDYLDALYYLAMAYYYPIEIAKYNIDERKHQPEKAIAYFEKINEICIDFKFEHNLFAARLAYLLRDFERAVYFAKICLKDPDQMPNLNQVDEAEMIVENGEFYDAIYSNPVPFEPVAVSRISTKNDEYLGKTSPDGSQFYFTRRMTIVNKGQFGTQSTDREFFTLSNLNPDGTFQVGEPLDSPFNYSENEGSPTVNLTNDLLVFARMKQVKMGGGNYPNYDLFWSQFCDGEWSEPESLGALVNLRDSWESQPSLTSAGDVIFFASDRLGGYGGSDIWYSKKGVDGKWQKPLNAGPVINTTGNERSPFIHTDSKTLYFSSSGHKGLGGMDIFYTKAVGEKWQKPTNIGYPINTENDDVDFFVSLDGKTGYYSSNKGVSNDWNIYQFELYEEARPKSVVIVKGEIDSKTADFKDISVEIRDTSMQVVASAKVDTLTGKYAMVAEVNEHKPEPLIVTVKKENFSYDTRFIDIDLKKGNTVQTKARIEKIEKGKTYDLRDINFPTNSYALNNESKKIIILFADFLRDNPSIKVEIQGHTDNVGNDKANQILSHNRAKAVYNYLIQMGFSSANLSYNGYGPFQPIATNDTEEGRAQNRRTVFKITNL